MKLPCIGLSSLCHKFGRDANGKDTSCPSQTLKMLIFSKQPSTRFAHHRDRSGLASQACSGATAATTVGTENWYRSLHKEATGAGRFHTSRDIHDQV